MESSLPYSAHIKKEALRLGFDGCGISKAEFLDAESERLRSWLEKGYHAGMEYMAQNIQKRCDPDKLLGETKSVVSMILNYYYPSKQKDPDAPVISRYAFGKDYHDVVKEKLNALLDYVRKLIPGSDGRAFTDSAPVMEHAWARRAGLGWTGKNSLLLNRKLGSFVFLGELFLDVELDYDAPETDHCGNCRKCIDSCPTGAIVADFIIDSNKCISYQTIENKKPDIPGELRERFTNSLFGCDICQEVCPWNSKSQGHDTDDLLPIPGILEMKRKDWYDMDRDKFNILFRKSALKRVKYEGIRRNLEFIRRPGD